MGNLKTRFKAYIEELVEAKKDSVDDQIVLRQLFWKLEKTTNISVLREVLGYEPLRIHLKKAFQSGRLIKDILNSDISDFSKSICFKYLNILVNGFDRPDDFRSWKVQFLRRPRRNRKEPNKKSKKVLAKDLDYPKNPSIELNLEQKSEMDSK